MKIITVTLPEEVHKAIVAARKKHGNKAFIEVIRDYIRFGLVLDSEPAPEVFVKDNTLIDKETGKPAMRPFSWE